MITFSITNQLRRLRADERGTVSILMGFLIIPLVGALGIGFEVSNWYMSVRGMQNASDTAALAAAANGTDNYADEAKAVAARYGYVDGTNTIRIEVSKTAPCPGGGNTCYSVVISGYVPLLLSQVVGFTGDPNPNGTLQKKLTATAVAKPKSDPKDLCMVALGSSVAQGIRTNGAPAANLNGCSVMSNTNAQCNGSNLGADFGFAAGTSNGCGAQQVSNVKPVVDPYASLATDNHIRPNPCPANPPPQTISGPLNLTGGNNFMCGNQKLTADVVINTPPGQPAVLIIEDGLLDLAGYSLRTSSGSAVTLVFSGTNDPSVSHTLTDTGHGTPNPVGLDITAPNTGPWSGVAIYQDPSLTFGVDVDAAGNKPTLNITGLIYLPHATVDLRGAVSKSSNGKSCVVLVADNFRISGTGGISRSDIGQCPDAGLKMPTADVPGRSMLVL